MKHVIAVAGATVALSGLFSAPASAQDWTRREFPLAPPNAAGNFVAPYFDGFYENEDGTYTLSFGFMNRNEEELIEIPLGPNNFIEPAQYDGMQPTSFPVVSYSGFGGPRERGTFGVVVPADFQGDVWWTLTTNGYTTKVPGRLVSPGPLLKGAYTLSRTPQAEGSLRPSIRFERNGPEGIGVKGVESPRELRTRVGEPVQVEFWAVDRGERELREVNMTLWKHQGPVGGEISFESLIEAPAQPAAGRGGAAGAGGRGGGRGAVAPGPVRIGQSVRIPREGQYADMGRFRASFGMPGEYVIRVRVDNFGGDSSPGNQCCWSNGYVRVRVTE